MAEKHNIVRVSGVTKSFELGKLTVQALKGVDLEIGAKSGSWFSYGSERIGQGRDAAIETIRDYTILSPRLAWHATDTVLIEAVAENLWPYQDSAPQRMPTSYFLSLKVSY